MNIGEILTLIVSVIAVLSTIAWTLLFKEARNLLKNAMELKADYDAGMADGNLSDEEKNKLIEHLVAIIQDGTAIYQTVANAVMKLIAIFGTRRK